MESSKTLKALFYPQLACLDEGVLKYLLLLYDKIYYLPNNIQLNPGHTRISSRFSINDSLLFGAFGSQKDAYYSLMYASEPDVWDSELKRLMEAYDLLEEKGVCVALEDPAFASPTDDHPLSSAVESDLRDNQFLYYCEKHRNPRVFVPPLPKEARTKGGGFVMRPPDYHGDLFLSALCSERINSSLYFAGLHDLVPVSNHSLFIRLFNLKLKRALANPDFRGGQSEPSVSKRKARLSTLSWQPVTEVVPPEALIRRSVSDVLRYKEESRHLSERFRSYLFRLEAGLSTDPWDDAHREEIETLVRTEVIPEVVRIREAKGLVWEKLYNEALKTTFSEAALKTLAPMLTMHFIPGLSYGELLCYATAALVGPVLPKLLDARSEEARVRRNALFFVLNL